MRSLREFFGDAGKAVEFLRTRNANLLSEIARHKTRWSITRWENEEDRERGILYRAELAMEMFGRPQRTVFDGNLLLNEGMNALWTILCGSGETLYNNANAQLGVGTSSTAADPSDSALTDGVWKGMETSFPTYGTGNKATWKSSFGTSEANQAWNEFSVRNGASADKMLNRKVSAQGTKVSGQTWDLTLDITLS